MHKEVREVLASVLAPVSVMFQSSIKLIWVRGKLFLAFQAHSKFEEFTREVNFLKQE
jgi:hypothetical protein